MNRGDVRLSLSVSSGRIYERWGPKKRNCTLHANRRTGPAQGGEALNFGRDEGKFLYGFAKEFTRARGEHFLSREKILAFAKEAGFEPVTADDSFLKSH
jgi:hypothetical protein